MMKKWLGLSLMIAVGVLLIMIVPKVMACGGFFCTTVPIDQSAERIIFTVNGDGTITAIVGIGYTGAAEDFSWVVPVPNPPELDVADTNDLDTLQQLTDLVLYSPPNYCQNTLDIYPDGVGGGGGMFVETGGVGPYNYAIVGSQNPDELVTWLRDNGYRVTEDMIPIIEEYVDEGMFFLAMKLKQEADVSQIQPIVMTYESEHPMIPIRLTAVAATPNMPVMVWIFADTQYAPANYEHVPMDFSQFDAPSELLDDSFWFDFFNAGFGDRNDIPIAYQQIQDTYDGRAFITEYAQPSENLTVAPPLMGIPFLTPNLDDMMTQFPYVTRLRAQLSPEQMTIDPYFMPAPELPDVSNLIELSEHVDPIHYWGCSTRTLAVENVEEILPQMLRIDDWHFHMRYPAEWDFMTLDLNDAPIYVVSPEAVTIDDIKTYLQGDSNHPPMMIAYHTRDVTTLNDNNWAFTFQGLLFPRLFEADSLPQDLGARRQLMGMSGELFAPRRPDGSHHGVQFAVLVNQADFDANPDLYRTMVTHAQSRQFYTDAELQHTVFINNVEILSRIGERVQLFTAPLAVAYPDGWIESLTSQENPSLMIHPENDDSTYFRVIPNQQLEIVLADTTRENYGTFLDSYGLEESVLDRLPAFVNFGVNQACPLHGLPFITFEHEGRQGYLFMTTSYVIEASALSENFVAQDTVLRQILNAIDWVECS